MKTIINETKAIAYIIRKTESSFAILAYSIGSSNYSFLRLPGGGVKQNESILEGLYREIREEAGIEKSELTYLRKIGEIQYFKPNNYKNVDRNDFLFLYNGNLPFEFSFNVKSEDKDNGFNYLYKWLKYSDFSSIDNELCQFLNAYNIPELFIDSCDFGLEKGKLTLSSHNPTWKTLFCFEEYEIKQNLNIDCSVMHIGSTAIKDLIAKPIIDIMIGLNSDKERVLLKDKLEKIGYKHHGEYGIQGRDYFSKTNNNLVLYHLHAYLKSDRKYDDHIKVIQTLNDNSELRDKYAEYKRCAVTKARDEYTNGKIEIMNQILAC